MLEDAGSTSGHGGRIRMGVNCKEHPYGGSGTYNSINCIWSYFHAWTVEWYQVSYTIEKISVMLFYAPRWIHECCWCRAKLKMRGLTKYVDTEKNHYFFLHSKVIDKARLLGKQSSLYSWQIGSMKQHETHMEVCGASCECLTIKKREAFTQY